MVEEFNASITFDKTLYKQDIRGSIAHATMLQKMGHLSPHELEAIVSGLSSIEKKIASGELTFTYKDEDIHMAIESQLIKDIGDTGRKLHTARSRNDQVILDVRLYLKEEMEEICKEIPVNPSLPEYIRLSTISRIRTRLYNDLCRVELYPCLFQKFKDEIV